MNTLQDLRDTLDQHASGVHDDPAVARVAAVRGRARRVRQQRAAGVVGAAVVAVLAAGTLSLLPSDRDPVPADRELIGREAPETFESLGYTYAFAEGVESGPDTVASVRLSDSDEPRLITWAADAEEVRLDTPYDETRSTRTDFNDFAIVHPAETGRWSIRAGGADAAIAVYELTDDLPAGIAQDGVFFREQVGSERLVDAAFSEVGDTELLFRTTLPEGRLRLAEYCAGVPDELWVNVSINGDGGVGSTGCDDEPFDAAVGTATWLDEGEAGAPGETVDVRVWLSRAFGREPVERAPGARLALGLYALGDPAALIAGWPMPEVKEHDGHLWRFVQAVRSGPGQDRLEYRNGGEEAQLVVGSYSRIGRATLVFRTGPDDGVDRVRGGLGGSDLRGLLPPSVVPATMQVRGVAPAGAEMGLAVYERID